MLRKKQLILMVLLSFIMVTPLTAAPLLQLTNSPQPEKSQLTLKGTTQLKEICLCLRGPAGEIIYENLTVKNNYFEHELCLRFGPGHYTLWLGESESDLTNASKLEVYNFHTTDLRFLAPSTYVNSQNKKIMALSNSLITSEMTEQEKLKALYQWVTQNITYNYQAYEQQENNLKPASITLAEKKGLCRDYAFLLAALARASGLEAKVVYGEAQQPNGQTTYHAWNEIKIAEDWVSIDATWRQGYSTNKPLTHLRQEETLY